MLISLLWHHNVGRAKFSLFSIVRPITEFITGSCDSNRPIMCLGKIRYYCKILYVSTHECCLIKNQEYKSCAGVFQITWVCNSMFFSDFRLKSSFHLFFTSRDMFLEFLVHTDENVKMYSWKKDNEDNWQVIILFY